MTENWLLRSLRATYASLGTIDQVTPMPSYLPMLAVHQPLEKLGDLTEVGYQGPAVVPPEDPRSLLEKLIAIPTSFLFPKQAQSDPLGGSGVLQRERLFYQRMQRSALTVVLLALPPLLWIIYGPIRRVTRKSIHHSAHRLVDWLDTGYHPAFYQGIRDRLDIWFSWERRFYELGSLDYNNYRLANADGRNDPRETVDILLSPETVEEAEELIALADELANSNDPPTRPDYGALPKVRGFDAITVKYAAEARFIFGNPKFTPAMQQVVREAISRKMREDRVRNADIRRSIDEIVNFTFVPTDREVDATRHRMHYVTRARVAALSRQAGQI